MTGRMSEGCSVGCNLQSCVHKILQTGLTAAEALSVDKPGNT